MKAFASPGAFATYLRRVLQAIPSDLRRAAVLPLTARIAALGEAVSDDNATVDRGGAEPGGRDKATSDDLLLVAL